jgi:glycosyltransferase involved in cell wall biosynthesis
MAETFDHEVDIFTRALKKNGASYTDTETYGDGRVRVNRLRPTTEYWNTAGRLCSLVTPVPKLVRGDYDIIHGHTFLPSVPTQLGGHLSSTPTVFTVHGTALSTGVGKDRSRLTGIKRRLEHYFILGFDYDHVISVNRHHLDLLDDHHESLSYIPNGVDVERFDKDTERNRDILFLGRLDPKKRVSDLIEAFGQIADEYPDTRLVIVGAGSLEAELKEQARKTAVRDRIVFEGRVPDEAVPEYYASSELFVLPSVWEGHPLTVLEAWASGIPVITTEVEGIQEFVDHKENGYLVPPESPTDIANALRTSLDDPESAREWARQARELVSAEYSWEAAARRTEGVYREVT